MVCIYPGGIGLIGPSSNFYLLFHDIICEFHYFELVKQVPAYTQMIKV